MRTNSINIEMLQIVAKGLGKLKNEVVFVGGAVAELYISDPGASEIRPTTDVDCVIELSTRLEYTALEKKLREKKFLNDMSEEAPICRWLFKDIKVDVMPTSEKILGFSNRWYSEGIEYKEVKILPDNTKVFVFSVEYFLASKFEAYKGRGGNDLRQSTDFEDIIYIFDNSPDIVQSIENSKPEVKSYLKEACRNLFENDNLNEGVECALPYGSGDNRVEIIIKRIQSVTKISND